ncbi:MAG: response regulator [Candidatus Omnitrophica bacterium]|nr:response regulator [Candidatus Omnitrophota bacterium]
MPKQKILICDDSEGLRESLKLILEDDYKLILACDGEEAVQLTEKECPDLVLLDIKMPRLNGIEALKEIVRLRPQTKVLFITGYQYTDVAKDAIQLGALDYIVKPFEAKDLKETVKKLLKKK